MTDRPQPAGQWIRVDVLRQHKPRGKKLGAWGSVVIEAAWEICKANGKGGVLNGCYWDAEFIGDWTQFDKEPGGMDGIRKGMKACERNKSIAKTDDGSYAIRNWSRFQLDSTAVERNRRYRERKKEAQRPDTVTGREPTPVTPTGQDRTVPDKTPKIALTATPSGPVKMLFNYATSKWTVPPSAEDFKRWAETYPALDVKHQFRKATEWLISHPKKRKKDFRAYLTGWLGRQQERA